MEESIELYQIVKDAYRIPDIDLKTYSPLTLAYIGDGVYEMVVRTRLVTEANTQVRKLHKRASAMVNAGAQAKMIHALLPVLTEEEKQIYKRGRNANIGTKAKNASIAEYRAATGFEALVGYLYLNQETKRMLELIDMGISLLENQSV